MIGANKDKLKKHYDPQYGKRLLVDTAKTGRFNTNEEATCN